MALQLSKSTHAILRDSQSKISCSCSLSLVQVRALSIRFFATHDCDLGHSEYDG